MTAGRTLPWLQDRPEVNVWASWQVAYRDVIIRDAAGQRVGVFNLTTHDLGQPEHQAELERLLLDARR
jgi:hypothetical protein